MSIADVRKLPLCEKLEIMEEIGIELRERVEELGVPAAQRELLDSRRERVASGKATIRDWDQVMHTIGRP